jgi:hypothetical protein
MKRNNQQENEREMELMNHPHIVHTNIPYDNIYVYDIWRQKCIEIFSEFLFIRIPRIPCLYMRNFFSQTMVISATSSMPYLDHILLKEEEVLAAF